MSAASTAPATSGGAPAPTGNSASSPPPTLHPHSQASGIAGLPSKPSSATTRLSLGPHPKSPNLSAAGAARSPNLGAGARLSGDDAANNNDAAAALAAAAAAAAGSGTASARLGNLRPASELLTGSVYPPSASYLSPNAFSQAQLQAAAAQNQFAQALAALNPAGLNGNGGVNGQPASAASAAGFNLAALNSASLASQLASAGGSAANSAALAALGVGTPGLGARSTPETDAIDKWFEDLQHYEATLEEMAAASLDQNFKEELSAIEQCASSLIASEMYR